jgi:biotin carboxyl carrier protein
MGFEVKMGDRIANVELLTRAGSKIYIAVDDKKYNLDLEMVEPGVYSIICDNKSYNIELANTDSSKKYHVTTFYRSYNAEIIDSESKYLKSRSKGFEEEGETVISTPMPGKVVKIPVKVGDSVVEGETVIIVEAMKMQSEYKVKKDRVIKSILVKEGDTINANQPLIIVK